MAPGVRRVWWVAVVLLVAGGTEPRGEDVITTILPEPHYVVPLARLDFRPARRSLQTVPITGLDPSWAFASELRKDLIPRALFVEDGVDQMVDQRLAFSRQGDFDHDGQQDLAFVGVYERRNGERGNFLLILTPTTSGRWRTLFVESLPSGRSEFGALAQHSADLELWWCTSCDDGRVLPWDAQQRKFFWKAFEP